MEIIGFNGLKIGLKAYFPCFMDLDRMNFADNWARVFVVITFLTFGEAQIIGGIVPNLIAFSLFLGAIGYFASTGKMAEMFGWKKKN